MSRKRLTCRTNLSPFQKVKNAELLQALTECKGNLAKAAAKIGCSTTAIMRRMERFPYIREQYDNELDVIVDMAMDALKKGIQNGEEGLIKFALDRLGKKRGFAKQSVNVKVSGDPDNPIRFDNTFNLSGLSMDEKILIMKIAKRKKEEDIIDVSPVEEALKELEI